MISRRNLTRGAVVLLAAGGAYLVFGSSEERKVLGVIRELAAAAGTLAGDTAESRARRIQSVSRRRLDPAVVLTAPELGTLDGRDALVEALTMTHGMALELVIQQSDVRIGPGEHARATLLVELVYRLTGAERRERRDVRVELVRQGDDYRVQRVEAGPASREEPEARP